MNELPTDRTVSFEEYDAYSRSVRGQPATQAEYQWYTQMRQQSQIPQTQNLGSIPGQQPSLFGSRPQTQTAGYQSGPDFGLGGTQQPGGGVIPDWLKGAGSWLLKNWQLPLAAVSAYSNAKSGQRAEDFQNEALGISRERWAAGEPLRNQALGMLSGPMPTAPDLSAQFSDPGNPYNRITANPLPAAGPTGFTGGSLPNPGTPLPAAQGLPPTPGAMNQGQGYVPRPGELPSRTARRR